jgi:hypothetical protein
MEKDLLQPIKLFIFDLFGVVIEFDDASLYERLSSYAPKSEVACAELHDLVSRVDHIRGQRTLGQLHQQLVDAHDLRLTFAEF